MAVDGRNEMEPSPGQSEFNPLGPLVKCSFLSSEFIECLDPHDHRGNKSAKEESGILITTNKIKTVNIFN